MNFKDFRLSASGETFFFKPEHDIDPTTGAVTLNTTPAVFIKVTPENMELWKKLNKGS
jgi:hypothetical protein